MINENENIQPELNMVSEESTAPVAEPQSEPVAEPQSESQTDFDSGESTSFTETPAVETQSSSTDPSITAGTNAKLYVRTVDSNNDGLFIKIKKNATATVVQIA